MTFPTPSHADNLATVRSALKVGDFSTDNYTHGQIQKDALAALDRLASEPSPDAIRDAALEEAAKHLEEVALIGSYNDKAAGYIRALKSQPAKEI